MSDPADEEKTLVARSRKGDTQAFDALMTLHRSRVYAIILQIVRNEEDAMDLTQEAFFRAWKALPRFDGKAKFTSWIHRIATNASLDWLRRVKARPQATETVEEYTQPVAPGGPDGSPTARLDRKEMRRRIDEAIASLSPDHRAVIVLKEVEDLSYKEIAATLRCSIGTVMSRLFYARKNLQKKLADLHETI